MNIRGGRSEMSRKIIQILINDDNCVYALCDDGTVWFESFENEVWLACPPIPQGDVKPSAKPEPESEGDEE
jgi:hypothetical protein